MTGKNGESNSVNCRIAFLFSFLFCGKLKDIIYNLLRVRANKIKGIYGTRTK